ncbi:hypothetical protein RRG08_054729 [Elysia crispata]|uniref:Uncharacterized protein n=1 Tax=Elysia crispata TaxID=231223 RepID=A0AAE1B360_9GAST|nr:hypothetical protein RRG08_054729 [Elysia crispata]
MEPQPQAPPTWRTPLPPQTLSPPRSRIIELRNLSDFHQRNNIDLSPSREDEDLVGRCPGQQNPRKSNLASSLHRPSSSQGSSSSSGGGGGQACAEPRPSLGSLSQYILGDPSSQQQHQLQQLQPHNNLGRGSPLFHAQDQDMPPPMNPINIRTILGGLHNHSQEHNHHHQHQGYPNNSSTPGSTVSRDSNTSLHLINSSGVANGGESHYGTGTSGYGSAIRESTSQGVIGKSNVGCPQGPYDPKCPQNCNSTCSVCDSNEECIKCSQPGLQLPECTKSCLRENFGLNCKQRCSLKCLNRECDPKTGDCTACRENIAIMELTEVSANKTAQPIAETKLATPSLESVRAALTAMSADGVPASVLTGCMVQIVQFIAHRHVLVAFVTMRRATAINAIQVILGNFATICVKMASTASDVLCLALPYA